ncbi:tRNA (adenosine(37)-N6)-threonylcarbamoyltransferase complex dimerization subunit type 1 TsaB [Bacteroidota bacterium]
MPFILSLETATSVCSVALAENDNLLSIRETHIKNSHSELITVFIDEVLKDSEIDVKSLDAVAVSKGPGSYTGLRIGVSTAKGLCYALDIPLLAINTLKSMAWGAAVALTEYPDKDQILLIPMIDARRMEVYSAIYDMQNNEIRETKAEIINDSSFDNYLGKYEIILFGNGASKCKELFNSKSNLNILDEFHPSSKYMIHSANNSFKLKQFEDVAYFEPFYLKDFIAGKPNVKGLH